MITAQERKNEVDILDYEPYLDKYGNVKQYGPDEIPDALHPCTIWTCLDAGCECDAEEAIDCECEPVRIVAGKHYVNRLYYVITRKPWVTGDEWE
jgi:hypothetical protein